MTSLVNVIKNSGNSDIEWGIMLFRSDGRLGFLIF